MGPRLLAAFMLFFFKQTATQNALVYLPFLLIIVKKNINNEKTDTPDSIVVAFC